MTTSLIVHHHPRLEKGAEGIRVVIPVRFSSFIHAVLWIWFGTWIVLETALVVCLTGVLSRATPNPFQSLSGLIVLLGLSTLAGAFMAWRLLWVIRGREILDLTRGMLRLHREPGGASSEEFDRLKIRNLRIGSYDKEFIYPSWGRRFIGKGDAFIGFDYEGRTVQLARGLSPEDAQYVVDLIQSVEPRVTS